MCSTACSNSGATGESAGVRTARRSGEYLLERALFRRKSTGRPSGGVSRVQVLYYWHYEAARARLLPEVGRNLIRGWRGSEVVQSSGSPRPWPLDRSIRARSTSILRAANEAEPLRALRATGGTESADLV
jgi:hypothetical protein